VWLAASLAHGGTIGSYLVLSWLASLAGSTIDVGIVIAVRTLPHAVLGLPVGFLADRVDRRGLLITSQFLLTALMVCAGALIGARPEMTAVLVLAAAIGALDAVRGVASQTYVYDLVGREHALRGISMTNLGMHLTGVASSAVTGFILAGPGVGVALLLFAGLYGLGGAVLLGGFNESAIDTRNAELTTSGSGGVRGLVVICLANEVLGFSSVVLLPVFALEVLGLGPAALGALYAVRSFGGVLALAVLTVGRSTSATKGLWASTAVFGLSLIGFALLPVFGLMLLFSVLIGAASNAVDALMQTLLQTALGDQRRGTGMGIWYVCLGFGPIGHIELAVLADVAGPQRAQAANGVLLTLVGLLAIGAALRAKARFQ